jgi:hypothetical protein
MENLPLMLSLINFPEASAALMSVLFSMKRSYKIRGKVHELAFGQGLLGFFP